MRMRRRWLLLVLGGLLAVPMTGSARTILAATPISRMDLPWWRARHEAKLKEIATARPELIFLGDSITQDWEDTGPPEWRDFAPVWQRFYGDRHAVNLGFKGDTTASLIWRIRNGEVAGIAPKAAVILIGANNLGRVHWSAEDTVAGIDTIISDLHHRLPQTKLLLLAVLPSERSAWITETTSQINQMLAARYNDDKSVAFLDLTALFMRGGKLNRDLFLDPKLTPPDPPLHPSAQGQAIMAKAMEPVLATMLDDKPRS
jgi:lysophospholipase L1-like esterase